MDGGLKAGVPCPTKLSKDGGNLSNLSRFFRGIQTATAVADLSDGFVAHFNGECRTEQDAKTLGDAARGLVGLGRLTVPEGKPELLRAFDGIKVDQKQNTIQPGCKYSARPAGRNAADDGIARFPHSLKLRVRKTGAMKKAWIIRALCLTGFLAALGLSQIEPARPAVASHWWKGNLHTHTLNSDGDSTPDEVARWYRDHHYNFLVLTDHNYLTDVRGLNSVHGAADRFLMIPGEEVTDRFQNKPVHVNAFGPTKLILPLHGESVAATLRNNVGEILRKSGFAIGEPPEFRVGAHDSGSAVGRRNAVCRGL